MDRPQDQERRRRIIEEQEAREPERRRRYAEESAGHGPERLRRVEEAEWRNLGHSRFHGSCLPIRWY